MGGTYRRLNSLGGQFSLVNFGHLGVQFSQVIDSPQHNVTRQWRRHRIVKNYKNLLTISKKKIIVL